MSEAEQKPDTRQPAADEEVSEMSIRPKQTAILLGVFVLIVALIWFGISTLGDRALQGGIAQWEAAGNPVKVAQVKPEPVAPADNAALLYVQAFAKIPSLGPGDLQVLRSPWAIRNTDALADLVAAAQEPLSLAHQAAELEHASWPLDYSSADALLDSVQENVVPARVLAQLLSAEAVVRAEAGDTEGAVRAIEAGLAMGNHLISEPLLVNLLVYLGELPTPASQSVPPGIEDIMLATLMVTFRDKPLPPNRLRELIAAAKLRQIYPEILASEGAVAVENFTAPDAVDRTVASLEQVGVEAPWWYTSGVAKADMGSYMRMLAADQEYFAQPLYQQNPAGLERPWGLYLLSTHLLPSRTRGMNLRIAAARGRLTMATTALMLREYKAEHGQYPDSLDKLPAVPLDPFTGRPLPYHKREEGKGFVIGVAGRGEAASMDWAWQ